MTLHALPRLHPPAWLAAALLCAPAMASGNIDVMFWLVGAVLTLLLSIGVLIFTLKRHRLAYLTLHVLLLMLIWYLAMGARGASHDLIGGLLTLAPLALCGAWLGLQRASR
ncbi:hypothetical protein [Chitinimonas sp. JJ19]|uniref:hypothetical protein n=1 Tax=Chitinimonas sp. JJ19 TaxID=3109352 RepID=UPI001A58A422|nr:hypothetical protein [Chitinimonas sp.]